MAIPDFQTLMRPVLVYLADGQVCRSRDITEAMSDQFALTAEERAEMLPSGTARLMANRVGWTLTHLTQAGLIDSAGRGLKVISEQGRAALDKHPERVDMKVLAGYPAYVEFRERKRDKAASEDDGGSTDTPPIADDSRTPNDLVESAVLVNRAAVESEVLSAALNLTPTGFEELVVRLLDKMGYGKAGSVNRTAASGDAGIDGIISQDPLGLDRIYVQAKRFTDTPVDRPKIHEFAGALQGKSGRPWRVHHDLTVHHRCPPGGGSNSRSDRTDRRHTAGRAVGAVRHRGPDRTDGDALPSRRGLLRLDMRGRRQCHAC